MGFLSKLFGRGDRKPTAAVKPTETIGTGGTAVYSGYLSSREGSADLNGTTRYKTYGEAIANVAIVGAGVRYFLNLIAGTGWKAEPADDSPEAVALAEQVERMLFGGRLTGGMSTPWYRVVRKAALFRFHGHAELEWTAKVGDDGVVCFADIELRPQHTIERWDVDASGTLRGVWQRSPHDGREIYLPREKLVYLVDDSLTDSPDGVGLLRHIAEPVRVLKRFLQLEGWGYETNMHGTPVVRAPIAAMRKTMTEAQVTAAMAPLTAFLENHIRNPGLGLTLDSGTYANTSSDGSESPSSINHWGLDLLQGSGGQEGTIHVAIERINREIARVLGVEHLLLGSDKGSFALAKNKSDTFAQMVSGTLRELAWTFESDLLGPLWKLNGWDEKLIPRLKPDPVQLRDVEEIVNALATLAQAGQPLAPDDTAGDEVRELIGLSRRPERAAGAMLPRTSADAARAQAAMGLPPNPAENEVDVDVADLDGEAEPTEMAAKALRAIALRAMAEAAAP